MSYLLELLSAGECLSTVYTDLEEMLLSGLQLDTEYLVTVSTVLGKRGQSKPVCKNFTNGKKPYIKTSNIVGCGIIDY